MLVNGISRDDMNQLMEKLRLECLHVKLTEEQCPTHDFELHFSYGIAA